MPSGGPGKSQTIGVVIVVRPALVGGVVVVPVTESPVARMVVVEEAAATLAVDPPPQAADSSTMAASTPIGDPIRDIPPASPDLVISEHYVTLCPPSVSGASGPSTTPVREVAHVPTQPTPMEGSPSLSILFGPMASDGELVQRYVAGDRAALGDIYERYADRVHDMCMAMLHSSDDAADAFQDTFLIAAQRLDGLRKPERLRPWLYSVARNQCRARLRARKRVLPEEDAGVDIGVDVDMTGRVTSAEITALVADAGAGLNDRDREVLELHMRHGLEGEDLAEILGVSVQSAYKLVQRVKGRVEKSIGSLLVARHGRKRCPTLDDILSGWDGGFDPLIRKRISRHIDHCDECANRRTALLDPSGMASAMPFTPAPAALRYRVIDSLMSESVGMPPHEPKWRGDGFPAGAGRGGRRMSAMAFAGVIGVVVLAGGALGAVGASSLLGHDSGPGPAAATTTTIGLPTTIAVDVAPPATDITQTTITPIVTDAATTTAPPATTTDTTAATTTSITTTTTSASTTTTVPPTTTVTSTTVPVTTVVVDLTPPKLATPITDAGVIEEDYPRAPCKYPTTAALSVEASDNIGVSAVWATWTVGGAFHSVGFSLGRDRLWHGTFGPFPSGTVGTRGESVTISINAIDTSDNMTTVDMQRPIQVRPCGSATSTTTSITIPPFTIIPFIPTTTLFFIFP